MRDFAVFILSHGRSENVITLKSLQDSNYTGKIYIIIDNEDNELDNYKKIHKEKIIIFDKKQASKHTDTGDNFKGRNVVVFARNEVHNIAKKLNLTHFLVLDDDYRRFQFKYVENNKLKSKTVKNLNKLFDKTLDYLDETKALSICYAQGGDFIGGAESNNFKKGILRKAMNVFFCRTDRPFQFYGRINEDLTTYVLLGSVGELFITLTRTSIDQTQTQLNKNGLTEVYLELGTYVKSFYSVIYNPSCVSVAPMGNKHKRLHHQVKWENAVPKILNEKYKKMK
jgi:hypothetical protein